MLETHKTSIFKSTLTMAYRNLLKTLHNPDKLLDVVIQPILFMLLFGYLFSGAIAGIVHAYLPTLVPGILMQSLISAATGSGTQISDDFSTGIFNRLKTLPIPQVAPLAGQLLADILRLLIAATVSLTTGYLMGWRPAAGLGWVILVVILDVFPGMGIELDFRALWLTRQKFHHGRKHFANDHVAPRISFECFCSRKDTSTFHENLSRT
jgi:ABC-2 type transport system permease protein